MSEVRVRFAPSPTGYFHVGGARTALFNWYFARQNQGTFILRIEDTDAERDKPEWTEGILSALSWVDVDWDEGPYFQSQRLDMYRNAARVLIDRGDAYYCECTREQIDERTKKNPIPGYDGRCRDLDLGLGEGRAVRFKVPKEGSTTVIDLIRGEPVFENKTIEDFIILRSNDLPIFVLANVVDDHDMRISHVIRGEEHLPNTPKVILLWKALYPDAEVPMYAHLPVIVNEKRQKLSKRRDKVAMEMYRDEGYLAPAMANYLSLLGWAPPNDREIVSRDEILQEFRLESVNKSSAFFDIQKLTYVNGEYIRALSDDEFIEMAKPFLADPPWPAERFDADLFRRMAPLVKERIKTLSEIVPMIDFFFVSKLEFDPDAWQKVMVKGADTAKAMLSGAAEEYVTCDWKAEVLHDVTLALAEKNELKLGKAQAPIRLAITGKSVGPPLFESLEVLGKNESIKRINEALSGLN